LLYALSEKIREKPGIILWDIAGYPVFILGGNAGRQLLNPSPPQKKKIKALCILGTGRREARVLTGQDHGDLSWLAKS